MKRGEEIRRYVRYHATSSTISACNTCLIITEQVMPPTLVIFRLGRLLSVSFRCKISSYVNYHVIHIFVPVFAVKCRPIFMFKYLHEKVYTVSTCTLIS